MSILCRLIAPEWANELKPRVIERLLTDEQIITYNKEGYNVYYFPNYPSKLVKNAITDGSDIDIFTFVFVDCDLKDGVYLTKDEFLAKLGDVALSPTRVVDSGNGVHAYWKVSDLDAKSYLRFQRRLTRLFNTDEAVGKLLQLMRLPGTLNTKKQDNQLLCEVLYEDDTVSYTSEQLDKLLPPISVEDETFCQQHYDRTYNLNQNQYNISEALPPKFGKLLNENQEAKQIWSADTDDRSKNDFRLGHLMFAKGFTKDEAMSVLVNSAKASQRSQVHRISYAENIVTKIWTFELTDDKDKLDLSLSVREILKRSGDSIKGTRFPCHPRIDNTAHGFRLGQVIGLVAGSGVGKTAFGLNMFKWFAESNPNYHHFFVPLEQPPNEIADRWKTMCGSNTALHDKIHVLSNYDDNGNFRHLSFDEIRDYIEKFKRVTGNEVGCVVIDHIGALEKKGSDNENQDLMTICHSMKAFAVQTNTLLVMQSQTSREKAGIGDLELDKDAAYGTSAFEWYCDYLVTMWQPLKRCHNESSCPTVTAFKFCKIRHKKTRLDVIQEDVSYYMYFDSEIEQLRDMTQDETTSFNYFLPQATNKRKADRKTELVAYQSVPYKEERVE